MGRNLPGLGIGLAAPDFQGFHQVIGEFALTGHAPQRDFRLVLAVEVGAAGDQEVQFPGQLQVQGFLLPGVLRVKDFQPRQAQAFQFDDQVLQGQRRPG